MATFKLGNVRRGGFIALTAAALFGASTPAAKTIVGEVQPLLLAGLLYLGSGVGLTIYGLSRRSAGPRLARADLPWLIGTVLFGGMLGPALLMWGLVTTTGSAASLLLTLEGVFTALMAWLVFREPYNARIGLGLGVIFAGALLLALLGPPGHANLLGSLAVAGACSCWAIDNNLTRKISHVDAPTLAAIKGLTAGSVNTALGLAAGAALPSLAELAGASLVGFLGYGVSLVLFVLALREVGAARGGAYFSTAPFIGAALSVVVLRDHLSLVLLLAGALMALGAWLHLSEPTPSSQD